VPFGLVGAALLSFWSDQDSDSLESAARTFGIGAAAAEAASEALQFGDRNAVLVLVFGLVLLAWFTLGTVRALVLSHALAWQVEPPRIRRPLRVFAVFNGLLLLLFLTSASAQWLEAELGRTALFGTILTLAATTGIALCVAWLLPHRATRGDLRRPRHRGDDARLAVRPQPPRHRRRLPQRSALGPPAPGRAGAHAGRTG
jgi:uncharacterized BrkB/YihY/UPF0761 family membrane protein